MEETIKKFETEEKAKSFLKATKKDLCSMIVSTREMKVKQSDIDGKFYIRATKIGLSLSERLLWTK